MSKRRNTPSGSIIAAAAGAMLAVGAPVTNDAGQPVRRYRKDLITAGEYVKSSTNQSFRWSAADLDARVATFNRMKAAGVKVPAPAGHTNDPEMNRGYVVEMFREGDTLFGIFELVGDDAIALAGRSEVSIAEMASFTDGKGNKYENAIVHVALVTDPVVPDQGGFVLIEASQNSKAESWESIRLAQESNMDWKKIAAALGLDAAALTDETAGDAILGAIAKMKGAGDKMAAEQTATAAKVLSLSNEITALKAKDAPKPSETEIRLSRKDRQREIDILLSAGHVTADQAKKLTALYIGENDAALTLSLDTPNVQRFEETVEILKLNKPQRPVGQQTGPNLLSRATPDGKDGPTAAEHAKYIEEMSKLAFGR